MEINMSIPIGQRIDEEYQNIRISNERIRQKRVSEIFRKIPRIERIDEELANVRVKMISRLADKGGISDISDQVHRLLAERGSLLESNGYPAEYTSAVYTCQKCSDTGYIMTHPCTCYIEKKMRYLYDCSNLSMAMKSQTFDKFNFDFYAKSGGEEGLTPYENALSVFTQCRNFVDRNEYEHGKNLILYGNTGLGKTFLCSCIAMALIDKGVQVLYQTAYNIASEMENQKFHSADNYDITDLYYKVPVLIIDDLGTEFSSSFTSSALFDIINSRLNGKKSTVISANMTMEELKKQYNPRIQSRIIGEYEMLKLYGQDIRTKKLLG